MKTGLVICLMLLIVGCSLSQASDSVPVLTAIPTAANTSPSHPFTPSPTSTPLIPDTGWQTLQAGLERRVIHLLRSDGRPYERLYILRLEPAHFRFDVAYSPGAPKPLAEWQQETGALIVLNGGFFTETWHATGLIITDGQPNGISYGDFAGMLAITDAGPELRWLATYPYDPSEPLLAGLQSFPLLVRPGGLPGFDRAGDTPARRTVIAQDSSGRFLLILATRSSFTLSALSRYLAESDLALDIALNLDGGTSTGLTLADPHEAIPSFVPLPAVITIYLR